MELDESIHQLIKTHCSEGDALTDSAQYEAAVAAYNKAWELIPDPKADWNASTWILAAIGDACFLGGYATSSKEALAFALTCPGGIGNPFIHMRLGQLAYDAGNLDAAANELMRTYLGAGDEIFENEDRKYLTFLGTREAVKARRKLVIPRAPVENFRRFGFTRTAAIGRLPNGRPSVVAAGLATDDRPPSAMNRRTRHGRPRSDLHAKTDPHEELSTFTRVSQARAEGVRWAGLQIS